MTVVGAAGSEATLRDGRVVTVRPLGAADAVGVEGLWRRLDAPARHRFTRLAHVPLHGAGEVALPRPGQVAGIVAVAPGGVPERVVGLAR